MLTEFGKAIRKIRIDNGHILKDMADALGVSSSYLSAVEVGKKNVPQDFVDRIAKIYHIADEQESELRQAAQLSVRNIKIPLDGMPTQKIDLALTFARRFETMSQKDIVKMFNVLDHGDTEDS